MRNILQFSPGKFFRTFGQKDIPATLQYIKYKFCAAADLNSAYLQTETVTVSGFLSRPVLFAKYKVLVLDAE